MVNGIKIANLIFYCLALALYSNVVRLTRGKLDKGVVSWYIYLFSLFVTFLCLISEVIISIYRLSTEDKEDSEPLIKVPFTIYGLILILILPLFMAFNSAYIDYNKKYSLGEYYYTSQLFIASYFIVLAGGLGVFDMLN